MDKIDFIPSGEVGIESVCSVCSARLVEQKRELSGIYKTGVAEEPSVLNYLRVLCCPKRSGIAWMFYIHHDRRIFADDGAEVVLNVDEYTISI